MQRYTQATSLTSGVTLNPLIPFSLAEGKGEIKKREQCPLNFPVQAGVV